MYNTNSRCSVFFLISFLAVNMPIINKKIWHELWNVTNCNYKLKWWFFNVMVNFSKIGVPWRLFYKVYIRIQLSYMYLFKKKIKNRGCLSEQILHCTVRSRRSSDWKVSHAMSSITYKIPTNQIFFTSKGVPFALWPDLQMALLNLHCRKNLEVHRYYTELKILKWHSGIFNDIQFSLSSMK